MKKTTWLMATASVFALIGGSTAWADCPALTIANGQPHYSRGQNEGSTAVAVCDTGYLAVPEMLSVGSIGGEHTIRNATSIGLGDGTSVLIYDAFILPGEGWGVRAVLSGIDGLPIEPIINVNQRFAREQEHPSGARLASGGFVVVWESRMDDGSRRVLARLFESDGSAGSDEFIVDPTATSNQTRPVVTGLSGGGFAIAWQSADGSHNGISTAVFNTEFNRLSRVERANQFSVNRQEDPEIAALPSGGYAVVWRSDYQIVGSDIFFRIFDERGAPSGNEHRANQATAGNQLEPSVAGTVGGFSIVWRDYPAASRGSRITHRRFDSSGAALGDEQPVTSVADSHFSPRVVGITSSTEAVLYHTRRAGLSSRDLPTAHVALLDAQGSRLGPELSVSGVDGALSSFIAPTLAGGFSVGWINAAGEGQVRRASVEAQCDGSDWTGSPGRCVDIDECAATTCAHGGVCTNTEGSFHCECATGWSGARCENPVDCSTYSEPNAVVSYSDGTTLGSRASATCQPGYVSDGAIGVTEPAAPLGAVGVRPDLTALPDGSTVTVWSQFNLPGGGWDIMVQHLSTTGKAIHDPMVLHPSSPAEQDNPAVASLLTGDVVIAYEWRNLDGSGETIAVQCLGLDDSVATEPRVANQTVASNQTQPSVAALASGGFVVAWQSYLADSSGWGVRARVFNSSCAPVGDELEVNSVVAFDQKAPEVAATTDRGFVVVYETWHEDGSLAGIAQRRFDRAGHAEGPSQLVNQTTRRSQSSPSVAPFGDGWVVGWESYDTDSAGDTVARVFSADGVGDAEFLVGTGPGAQTQMTVAGLRDGSLFAAWEHSPLDEWASVRAMQLSAGGVPVSEELILASTLTGDCAAECRKGASSPSVATSGQDAEIIWYYDTPTTNRHRLERIRIGDTAVCTENGEWRGQISECVDDNECNALPCQNGGLCVNLPGEFECHCPVGTDGDLCEIIDYCAFQPCDNGGVCATGVDGFTCDCPAGWTGPTCGDVVDHCDASPCQNGALCSSSPGGFTCDCPTGFSGPLCGVVDPENPGEECTEDCEPQGIVEIFCPSESPYQYPHSNLVPGVAPSARVGLCALVASHGARIVDVTVELGGPEEAELYADSFLGSLAVTPLCRGERCSGSLLDISTLDPASETYLLRYTATLDSGDVTQFEFPFVLADLVPSLQRTLAFLDDNRTDLDSMGLSPLLSEVREILGLALSAAWVDASGAIEARLAVASPRMNQLRSAIGGPLAATLSQLQLEIRSALHWDTQRRLRHCFDLAEVSTRFESAGGWLSPHSGVNMAATLELAHYYCARESNRAVRSLEVTLSSSRGSTLTSVYAPLANDLEPRFDELVDQLARLVGADLPEFGGQQQIESVAATFSYLRESTDAYRRGELPLSEIGPYLAEYFALVGRLDQMDETYHLGLTDAREGLTASLVGLIDTVLPWAVENIEGGLSCELMSHAVNRYERVREPLSAFLDRRSETFGDLGQLTEFARRAATERDGLTLMGPIDAYSDYPNICLIEAVINDAYADGSSYPRGYTDALYYSVDPVDLGAACEVAIDPWIYGLCTYDK